MDFLTNFFIPFIDKMYNKNIVKKACNILHHKFSDMIHDLESDIVPITTSESTIENCYDIILENEDYTIGKVLEYFLYETYYMGEELFSYCGFKKIHPHDSDSKIRIAYKMPTDKHMLRQHLKTVCVSSIEIFEKINKMF
jgi:DNA-directed RNA polymerase subunit L